MAAASPLAESADASAVHDLTRTLAQHLDRHLVVPMLDFLLKKNSVCRTCVLSSLRGCLPRHASTCHNELQIHERRQVLEEKLRLVAGTSLVDVEVETWKELNAGASAVPKGMPHARCFVRRVLSCRVRCRGVVRDVHCAPLAIRIMHCALSLSLLACFARSAALPNDGNFNNIR